MQKIFGGGGGHVLEGTLLVCNITAGHWPFSASAKQFQLWLAILSEQIREVTFIEILNNPSILGQCRHENNYIMVTEMF